MPGFALDLTSTNAKGESWDSALRHREAARELLVTEPMSFVKPPRCSEVSPWQALKAARFMDGRMERY